MGAPRLLPWLAVSIGLATACTEAYEGFVVAASSSGSGSEGAGAASAEGGTTGPGSGSGGVAGAASGMGGATAQSSATSSGSGSGGAGGIVIDLSCDGAACPAGQVCCFAGVMQRGSTCAPPGTCGVSPEVACDGPDDCPADTICCATFSLATATLYGVHCAATCSATGEEFWLCTGDDTACLPGQYCIDDIVLGGGYKVCTQ